MSKYSINEDIRPQKIPVWFIPDITNRIRLIYEYNINKQRENAKRWYQDIVTITNHISERTIGFDYLGHKKSRWGRNVNILGHRISYSIKSDKEGNVYICIYKMNLNTEDYGLIDPSALTENKTIIIKESQLRGIIRESIKRILNIA